MTLLTAHPEWNLSIRRLASVSSRRYIVDVLSNRDGLVRADWDYSFTLGRFTIAVLAR